MGHTFPNLPCQIALSLGAGACEEADRAKQQHRHFTPPHPLQPPMLKMKIQKA